jgi:hypothetical protein
MTVHRRREVLRGMDAGESIMDLARTFGVDRATLYRAQAAAPPWRYESNTLEQQKTRALAGSPACLGRLRCHENKWDALPK